jgi:hypothetical protein
MFHTILQTYITMTDLEHRLLASIENHGKSDMKGIYKLYPHEKPVDIDKAIAQLDADGWVHYRKSQVIDGDKKNIPNVRRSSKQLYVAGKLFDADTL